MQPYDKVCRDITGFHPNILATGVAEDAEFLAYHFKEQMWLPKPERLTVMLGQAMLMTGIPELNEDFFGKTRVVTVQHDKMHVLLFPAGGGKSHLIEREGERSGIIGTSGPIVVVLATPLFQHGELVNRILEYMRAANICTL